MLNIRVNRDREEHEGDDHAFLGSAETPMRPDAFEMDDESKIQLIKKHFTEIMHVLGMDMTDDSLKNTPDRVAKMFVQEIFSGLNPANKPKMSQFENKYQYNQMLIEKDISLYSYCEHHFVPIIGKVHVAYVSNGTVIGLSKINRLVQYFGRRPQVQERLTLQIAQGLSEALNTPHVAVYIEAEHLCVASRGVRDTTSKTITVEYLGKFKDEATKTEFLELIRG
ncbi:MAG TPA: GTP cyclohydrolase I FolE [Cytophagaceae bacterium]|jgi:GTP cyclohydrolase I|nr:GTP cyclohydrolase I FolE [Cytophagaceae bacterium]